MYAKIEELATKRAGLTKVSKNHYEFRGEKNAQAHLGILVFNCLKHCDWFAKNVKSWEWLGDSNDENYVGDIGIIITNNSSKLFYVTKGAKLAQFTIKPVYRIDLVEVQKIKDTERGESGYGSSGF